MFSQKLKAGVDGEEEQDDQEYDDEYEEEDQGEHHPEPIHRASNSFKPLRLRFSQLQF